MKKLIFGIIATVFMSALSVNAQERQSVTVEFGLMSQYQGPCVPSGTSCVNLGGTIKPGTSFATASRLNESTIVLNFSEKFYAENERHLSKGFIVETSYSFPKSLTESLGFTGEFVIPAKTYSVVKRGNEYELKITRR